MVNPRNNAEGRQTSKKIICRICLKNHPLKSCHKFLQVDYEERMRLVSIYRYCAGCLAHDHTWRTCESTGRCGRCGDMHHTLLHKEGRGTLSTHRRNQRHRRGTNSSDRRESTEPSSSRSSTRDRRLTNGHESERPSTSQALVLRKNKDRNARRRRNRRTKNAFKRSTVAGTVMGPPINVSGSVLLKPTAMVNIESNGRFISERAIIDANSEVSIISEEVARRISARRINVGDKEKCLIRIGGNHGSSTIIEVYAEIKRNLNMMAPPRSVDGSILDEFPGLQLADPHFNSSSAVNLLLGGDVYSRIIRNGVYGGSFGKPLAQYTIFGYIISGLCSS
ncbi:uncharacterized protein LOC135963159 [Calliphora vicina]|uniref:uncharacterized protein LOC135963159 n=1 Tax=Calliphora vicina TaxID=7373 RepID=UPI00325AEE55